MARYMPAMLGLMCVLVAPAEARQPFGFGIEYLETGLAKTYAAIGATWGKPRPEPFQWGSIEPKAPVGGVHHYDWTYPDRLIREWQDAGLRNYQIYLQSRNPWAAVRKLPPGHASVPIKPRYMADYRAWLRAVVDRYNDDGRNDMPGLRYPVRYWEIEAEWGTFWPGTAAEYLKLLRAAHATIKQADPQAKIILQGILLWGIFEGAPDEAEVQRRLSAPVVGPARRRILANVRAILGHPELFDIVEFHSLSDWSDVFGTVRFLRGEMARHGYKKPIWAGDVNANLNPMVWWNQPNYPYTEAQKAAALGWIEAMRKPGDPRHLEALRWFRAEQSRFEAKKLMTFLGDGLAGANMGNLEDWSLLSLVPAISGTQGFCGLIDEKLTYAGGRPVRTVTGKRPAFYTLKMLYARLQGYGGGERLDLGKGVYAWRLTPDGAREEGRPRSAVVMFYDSGKGPMPGDPPVRQVVSLPTDAERVTVTPVITRIGQEKPETLEAETADGRATVVLTSAPVVVEEW